jgi:tRNA A22 N-methylase
MRALTPPYLFYIVIAGAGFTIIRKILKEANEEQQND